jgi:hypothetical protein
MSVSRGTPPPSELLQAAIRMAQHVLEARRSPPAEDPERRTLAAVKRERTEAA